MRGVRMKVIIDISEDDLDAIKFLKVKGWASRHELLILHGTPIPDNATNGDAIKAIFPNTEVDDYDYGKDPVIDVYGIDDAEYITLRKAWWNAPYQKGGKE